VSGMHEANNRNPYFSNKSLPLLAAVSPSSPASPTNAAPRVTAHNTCKPHGHDAV